MNSINTSYLGIGIIALFIILLVVFIIKKAIKLLVFLIIIILVISAYNVFVNKVKPIDLFNGFKTNISYGKDITDYSVKIKTSVANIKDAMGNKSLDAKSANVLKEENENLNRYLTEVKPLEHTEKLNSFHNSYCEYLKSIVGTSDNAIKLASSKNISGLNELLEQFNSGLDQLTKLSGDL
ncbi:MAG: hypothetical protein H7Y18_10280 [Clostridiaceae bacterium]|nr:hypothetical protein [Clostridiaceae bacterium]